MKWCRFELDAGPAYGLVEGHDVAVLSRAPFEAIERTVASIPLTKLELLPQVMPLNFQDAACKPHEQSPFIEPPERTGGTAFVTLDVPASRITQREYS